MKFRTYLNCVLALLLPLSSTAGDLTIPNSFQAGTPARAAEVNANFDAVEVAVDDNAQRVATLETTIGTAGVAVSVNGVVVGRYLAHGTGFIEVDLAASVGVGTELVAEAVNILTTSRIFVLSPTGYSYELLTGDFDHPFLSEGNLDTLVRFFDGSDCTGNTYFPVEGDTGWFSTFEPGTGAFPKLKRWAARQGAVFASPDPNDVTPVWMIRRGGVVQTVALGSFLVYAVVLNAPLCVNMATIPGFDVNNPLHVNHTVVPVEPNDSLESGVTGILGGEITVGL